ncbi:MAG: S-layer homology domain-containing protein [Lachnospiraceae bacterium]|nr:S-layer homology domain-containing protein [Lachnospiraceae bacterium]
MKEKDFFNLLIRTYRTDTGTDPAEYSMGAYLDVFLHAYPEEKAQVRLTRKTCARILHEFMKNVLGYPDIDWDRAKELKDIYDCKVCANSIAQVYERGIMAEYAPGVFGLEKIVSEEEARAYIEVIRGYM